MDIIIANEPHPVRWVWKNSSECERVCVERGGGISEHRLQYFNALQLFQLCELGVRVCVCMGVFCLCIEAEDEYIRYISTVRRLPFAHARAPASKLFRNSNYAIRRLIVWARSGLILWHIFRFPVENARWHTLWRLTLFTWDIIILFNPNLKVFIIHMLIACGWVMQELKLKPHELWIFQTFFLSALHFCALSLFCLPN